MIGWHMTEKHLGEDEKDGEEVRVEHTECEEVPMNLPMPFHTLGSSYL